MFKVFFTPAYDRAYDKLPATIQQAVDDQIQRLRIDPRHPSLRTHKRRGEGEVWQARITRDYRLFFHMQSDTITLLDVHVHDK